jgi:hypothetical protein
MRVQLPIKGITSTPVYGVGDAHSLVNLRYKGGALTPVTPRKVTGSAKYKYDILTAHNLPSGTTKYIGTIYSSSTQIYVDNLSGTATLLGTITGEVKAVEQTGNILTFITDNDRYYVIYRDLNYQYLGSLPELPQININTFQVSSEDKAFTATKTNFETNVKAAMYLALNDCETEAGGRALDDAHMMVMAYRLYDGTYIKHSSPVLVLSPYEILSGKSIGYQLTLGSEDVTGEVTAKTYGIMFHKDADVVTWDGDLTEVNNWKGVIQSLDIFLSRALNVSGVEMLDKNEHDLENKTEYILTDLVKAYRDSAKQSIGYVGNFYLIRSIPVDKTNWTEPFTPGQFPSGSGSALDGKDDDVITNLIFKEELTQLLATRHSWGAKKAKTYNNRLHLYDLTTSYFNGFPPAKIGQYAGQAGIDILPYNGYEIPWLVDYPDHVAIRVDIQLSDGLYSLWNYGYTGGGDYMTWLASPYFSYPDSRAVKVAFYVFKHGDTTWRLIQEKPLTQHPFLNASYYLDPDFKPLEDISNLSESTVQPENEQGVTSNEPNKLKVSLPDNPFTFENANTYQFNARIRAIANTSQKVSQEFGVYPMFVFTERGVYALQTGTGEVYYLTQAPVSNDEVSSDSVLATSEGIFYITRRGLNIVNGQGGQFISGVIEAQRTPISLPGLTIPTSDPFSVGAVTLDINAILQSNDLMMLHNAEENEIYIRTKTGDYTLVLREGYFYLSTEKYYTHIQNNNPDLKVIQEVITGVAPSLTYTYPIKDYSLPETGTNKAKCSFILRPLRFGTEDYKRLERIVVRCSLMNAEKIFAMIHAGLDGYNFNALRGIQITNATTDNPETEENEKQADNFKDINLKLTGLKYKYYSVSIAFTATEDSRIELIECEVSDEQNKLR